MADGCKGAGQQDAGKPLGKMIGDLPHCTSKLFGLSFLGHVQHRHHLSMHEALQTGYRLLWAAEASVHFMSGAPQTARRLEAAGSSSLETGRTAPVSA